MGKKQIDQEAVTPPIEVLGPPAEVLPVEVWAERKGMLPKFVGGSSMGLPPGARGLSRVSLSKSRAPGVNPEFWRFAAARAGSRWPEGKELTEAEFDAAVKATTEDHVIR